MASLKEIARECTKNLKNKSVFAIVEKREKSWRVGFYTTDTNGRVENFLGADVSPNNDEAQAKEKKLKELAFIAAYDLLVLHTGGVVLDYDAVYEAESKVTIAACEKVIREAFANNENQGERAGRDFKYFRNLTDEEKAVLRKYNVVPPQDDAETAPEETEKQAEAPMETTNENAPEETTEETAKDFLEEAEKQADSEPDGAIETSEPQEYTPMEATTKTQGVRGFKVFNPDWTCREKQYACPGKFEEDVKLKICERGMHFCERLIDCFYYYSFDPKNKIAEVVAYGAVVTDGCKNCTDKLEIVREISWHEALDLVNTGKNCTGMGNSGNRNSGDWNSGGGNSGGGNSGNRNSGNRNSGDWNSGGGNSGGGNSGGGNSGNWNSGNRNSGNWNSGNWNSGGGNSGNRNSGDWNSGGGNSGNRNSGNWNSGNWNSGDFNACSGSSGCFNTEEATIRFFNQPSDWTLKDWRNSAAYRTLSAMPTDSLQFIYFHDMTESEKAAHPKAETTGGYLKKVKATAEGRQKWWDRLSCCDKAAILEIPNFNADIFKKITGIDVNKPNK